MAVNAVYWFSGTGNSYFVARTISQRLGECVLSPIANLCSLPSRCERIGFVFPHYALGVPNLVRQKLEQTHFSINKNTYYFAVETYGGFKGNCLSQVRDTLAKKGAVLQYGTSIKMYANNVLHYDMDGDSAKLLEHAKQCTEVLAADVIEKKQNNISRTKHLQNFIYRAITSSYPKTGLQFHVTQNCVACKQCAKLCPADNIEMQDGRPVFGDKCEQCVACIQWCPQMAIQWGDKTADRKRYHHPEVTARELFRVP